MKKWIFVFICLLLFSGCTHSTQVKTDMVSKEEKQEDSGYKIFYDKAMFQAPDQIYVSEMIAKEIKKEDIFEMLDVPMKETIAKGLDKYHREEIYIWNNEKYELESAKNYYNLILRSKFNKDKKAKQMKIKSEEIQKKATKLFTKWEKIAGVTLDKEHMKMEAAEGEDGKIAILQGVCWDPNEFTVQELGFFLLAQFGYLLLAARYFEACYEIRYVMLPRCHKKGQLYQSIWKGLLVLTAAYSIFMLIVSLFFTLMEGEKLPSFKDEINMLFLFFFCMFTIAATQTWLCILVKLHIIIYVLIALYQITGIFSYLLGGFRVLFLINYGMLIRCRGYGYSDAPQKLFTVPESIFILLFICAVSYLCGSLLLNRKREWG